MRYALTALFALLLGLNVAAGVYVLYVVALAMLRGVG
jgi:hypothetical protein